MNWSVYMILCSDNSLYTGITTDVERRFQQHANQKGAKYFRSCQPLELVFVENGHNRSTASQREAQIKAMKRDEKLQMINAPVGFKPLIKHIQNETKKPSALLGN